LWPCLYPLLSCPGDSSALHIILKCEDGRKVKLSYTYTLCSLKYNLSGLEKMRKVMSRDMETLDAATAKAQFGIGVFGVILEDGKVLLGLRRDIEWWNLPGGGMEPGETVDEALCREVLEETGLEVQVGRLVGVYSKPQKSEVVLTFLCSITGGALAETEETRECRFFALDALPANTLPKHTERIRDALMGGPEAVVRAQRSSARADQRLPEK
jgi:ADP-ribose pyrophosphatase YjhB (NUDIX family)